MADIAASVLARLKNKAAESGRSYQLCLQLYCPREYFKVIKMLVPEFEDTPMTLLTYDGIEI